MSTTLDARRVSEEYFLIEESLRKQSDFFFTDHFVKGLIAPQTIIRMPITTDEARSSSFMYQLSIFTRNQHVTKLKILQKSSEREIEFPKPNKVT
jgi:hypothetical protein